MGIGLKKAWGLTDAKKAGSDKQAQEFKGRFQGTITGVGASLSWTAGNAEKGKHDEQASLRDRAFESYQSVLSMIDPTDPAKAARAIEDCLNKVKQLGSGVDKFKQLVETAKKAWEAVAGRLERVIEQIGELKEWGSDKAAPFLKLAKKVQDLVGKRMWEEAKEAFETLEEQLGPIWEEYEKQKKAKETYDKDRPRLEEEFRKIQKAVGELPGAATKLIGDATKRLDDAAGKAGDKDFVGGLLGLGGMGDALKRLGEMMAEMEKAEQAYEKRLGELKPRLEASKTPVKNPDALSEQAAIQIRRSAMETAAAALDFKTALAEATTIESDLASYEALLKQIAKEKTQFDAVHAKVKPRVDKAAKTVKNEALVARQKTILDLAKTMKTSADQEDWSSALNSANSLQTQLAGFETESKDVEQEKKEFEKRIGPMKKRMDKASVRAKNPKLVERQKLVAENRASLDKFEAAGDWDAGLMQLDRAAAVVLAYENRVKVIEKERTQYTARLSPLKPRLGEAAKAVPKPLAPLQTKIMAKEQEASGAAAKDDFDPALAALDWVAPALKRFEEAKAAGNDAEAEFKKRIVPVHERYSAACNYARPIKNKRATAQKKEIEKAWGEMNAADKKGDYDAALGKLLVLDSDLMAYEALLKKLEGLEEEFKKRLAANKTNLDKHDLPVKNPQLVAWKKVLEERRKKVEKAEADGDWEVALEELQWLEPLLQPYADHMADMEAERKQYKTRLDGLATRLGDAAKPVNGTELTARQDQVKKARADMEALAAQDDFDAALAQMDTLEVELSMFENLVKQQEARKAKYEKRLPGVKSRVKTASGTVEDPQAKALQGGILGALSTMEGKASSGDFNGAIMDMANLELDLAAFETLVARLGQTAAEKSQPKTKTTKKQTKKTKGSSGSGASGTSSGDDPDATANPFDQPLVVPATSGA